MPKANNEKSASTYSIQEAEIQALKCIYGVIFPFILGNYE